MIETTKHLKKAAFKPAICTGVHAAFSDNAYLDLQKAHASLIVTSNTIPHESNKTDLSPLIIQSLT